MTPEVPVLPGAEIPCAYCERIPGIGPQPPAHPATSFDTPLAHGPGMIATPTVGMLAPGYMLAITRQHVHAVAQLAPDLLRSAEPWLEALLGKLSPLFGDYFIFEHGSGCPSSSAASGACILHAHFHLIPVPNALPMVQDALKWTALGSLVDLSAWANYNYALLGVDGHFMVCPEPRLPSQWVRAKVAAALGVSDRFDWYVYPGVEELASTFKTLGDVASPGASATAQ